MKQRSAEILCIGTELLMGDIINTNAAYLAKELAGLGINLYHQSVVGDNPERLRQSLQLALKRADIVITTGGLGPTYDDLSKETIAACFGRNACDGRGFADTHPGAFSAFRQGDDRQ